MMECWNIGMMDLKDWGNQSIVDASRLDLSSPAYCRGLIYQARPIVGA
jgi:hypothetical protein